MNNYHIIYYTINISKTLIELKSRISGFNFVEHNLVGNLIRFRLLVCNSFMNL